MTTECERFSGRQREICSGTAIVNGETISPDAVAFYRTKWGLRPIGDSPSVPLEPELPPVMIRGWNFAKAMARHAGNGFKLCEPEQIEERLLICQACPQLTNDHCAACGCACGGSVSVTNKLAIPTEKCPLQKW